HEKQDKLIAELTSRAHFTMPADFDASSMPTPAAVGSAPATSAAPKPPAPPAAAPVNRTKGQSTRRRPVRRP
ncbi:MAG TPA: hypothetical protein VE775_03850, partial [Pyrinomonadaceae bacterium]|nr:hypothetical protein [Pyrinomonadaceae bacterium]